MKSIFSAGLFAVLIVLAAIACGGNGANKPPSPTTVNTPETIVSATSTIPTPTATPGLRVRDGDRLIISRIGVDVPVVLHVVTPEGIMPDPAPNVGVYDFSALPGYGGIIGSGNLIIAGNVGNGTADNPRVLGTFEQFRTVAVGDSIQVTLDGAVYVYTVALRCAADRQALEDAFRTTAHEQMTLMQNVGGGLTQYLLSERSPTGSIVRCPTGQPY